MQPFHQSGVRGSRQVSMVITKCALIFALPIWYASVPLLPPSLCMSISHTNISVLYWQVSWDGLRLGCYGDLLAAKEIVALLCHHFYSTYPRILLSKCHPMIIRIKTTRNNGQNTWKMPNFIWSNIGNHIEWYGDGTFIVGSGKPWKIVVDFLNPPPEVLLIPFPNGHRNFHASIGHVVTQRHFPFLRSSLKYIKP